MEKYTVNITKEVMNFMDFQDFIKELFFDEVKGFTLRKEVKVFENSTIIDYTVISDGRIVSSACIC